MCRHQPRPGDADHQIPDALSRPRSLIPVLVQLSLRKCPSLLRAWLSALLVPYLALSHQAHIPCTASFSGLPSWGYSTLKCHQAERLTYIVVAPRAWSLLNPSTGAEGSFQARAGRSTRLSHFWGTKMRL